MSFDLAEDDALLSEWLDANENEQDKPTTSTKCLEKPLENEAIAPVSAGNPTSFQDAFAFLKPKAEEEFKACLPEGSTKTMESLSSLGSGSAIIVNPCQRGNPLLQHVRNVPWQYADKDSGMAPDYVMSATSCCLFLSLRYHALRPNYIYERVQNLRKSGQYTLRILLGLVDVKDPSHAVKELAKAALVADMTLLLAFSNEEAGTYIETFKSYKNKSAELIQKRANKNHSVRLSETLASVKSINSTDSHTLLSQYKHLSAIANASEYDLALLPGIGGLKAKRLHNIFEQPFLKDPKS